MEDLPTVSAVIPCYNEEATIGLLLRALFRQTFPRDKFEVVIADGRSNDRTLEKISEFCSLHPELRVLVVENPLRIIPAAVNTAIGAARGEVIVRLDAHSVPDERYIERSVRDLLDQKGDNVGGIWMILPGRDTLIGRSIAAAAAHPLGVGDAHYRFSNEERLVDTVPFGAFFRSTYERIGKFDETLLANEDYEFNARLRKAGGKIYLDPAIHSQYFARPDLASLSRQYWRYGYWKFRMLRRYPGTLRWRQALPPLFVAGICALIVTAPFWLLGRTLLWIIFALYLLILTAVSIPVALRNRDLGQIVGIPLAIATMHFSWGTGFIYSIIAGKR